VVYSPDPGLPYLAAGYTKRRMERIIYRIIIAIIIVRNIMMIKIKQNK